MLFTDYPRLILINSSSVSNDSYNIYYIDVYDSSGPKLKLLDMFNNSQRLFQYNLNLFQNTFNFHQHHVRVASFNYSQYFAWQNVVSIPETFLANKISINRKHFLRLRELEILIILVLLRKSLCLLLDLRQT